MAGRLDEERIEILRGWGAGLASADREELRAAGKAITVLIEEIDRLQIDLWNARAQEFEAAEARTPASAGAELEAGEPRVPASPGLALRQRLSRSQPQA